MSAKILASKTVVGFYANALNKLSPQNNVYFDKLKKNIIFRLLLIIYFLLRKNLCDYGTEIIGA